jgi:hypothetical protein
MAKEPFEAKPLLIAALLGAALAYLLTEFLDNSSTTTTTTNTFLLGALTGIGVQIGLRLMGVS